MAANRAGRPEPQWTNGPAKLTQALSITGALNGVNLTGVSSPLMIEKAALPPNYSVQISSRIGLGATPEPWLSLPWRFLAVPV